MLLCLALAVLATPPADAPKASAPTLAVTCPTCHGKGVASTSVATCPGGCNGMCPFPGACGHPGCSCGFMLGWVPPTMDRWQTFVEYPGSQFYGHAVGGRFLYSHFTMPGLSVVFAAPGHPAWQEFSKTAGIPKPIQAQLPVAAPAAGAKPLTGYICPCGSLCAAKRGGICGRGCGCPIGH